MICAIVLAAGRSSRMGRHKVLLPYGGKTIVWHIVDQLLHTNIDRLYVVVGYRARQVAEALADRDVTIVKNSTYNAGMLSSVRCGLRALPRQCRAVLLALGDQPAITSDLVDKLLQAFAATDKGILVPLYRGKRGHPILFSASYREEILASYDGIGLRGLIHAHPDDICDLTVATPAILCDLDSPEDYQREVARRDKATKSHHMPQSQ